MRRKQTAMLAAFVAAGVGLGVLAVLRGQETAPAGGAEKTPATQAAQPLVQRVYDIGDLVAPTRDSTHANALLPVTEINESVTTPQGSSAPPSSEINRVQNTGLLVDNSLDETRWPPAQIKARFRDVIMETVDPTSWKGKAPDTGEAPDPYFLHDKIIITQTPPAHEKIAELLRQFRENLTRQFVVQGWWVQADEKDLSALLAGGKGADPRQVNPDALKAAKVLYRGRIVCTGEQRTFVASGREFSAVLAMNAIVSEGASEIVPDVRVVHAGMILETRAQLSDDRKNAHLDLWSTIGRPRGPVVPVDRKTLTQIDADAQCFRTAVTVPLGVPILTGGGTYGEDGKGMYLVVQVDCVGK